MRPGKVYLVGAGPGAADLITVRGLECLRAADVIVYDHLANATLLGEARPAAEVVYVGKSSSRHTLRQGEINRLLAAKALEGKVVVRLKGGDPFVFGRGGEEAEALVKAGVPFEVVPGVTSAVAVPAFAGIPITHRKMSSSFAAITGHETPDKEESSIDWGHLALGVDTLVFLMGVANLGYIAGRLLEAGRPADTPVAVIREGTLPGQQVVVGTLSDIEERAGRAGITPPAVIVVGAVVELSEKLDWFSGLPLSGKRVLVTRTREQAGKLSRMLEEQGARAVELPTISVEAVVDDVETDRAVRGISSYDWVFFTSANGVEAFMRRLCAVGGACSDLGGVKVGAIGPATAAALARHGLRVEFVPRRFVAEGVLEDIPRAAVEGKRVLLPRADIARDDLATGLERLGALVDQVAVYRTLRAKGIEGEGLSLLRRGAIDVITFTSSSTVRNLVGMLGGQAGLVNRALVACIGPVTAATAGELGIRVDVVAGEHTVAGLVQAVVRACAGARET